MQHRPSLVDQVAVQEILIEGMSKPVTRTQRAVRQLLLTTRNNQAVCLLQSRHPLFDIDFINSQQLRNNRRKELRALNTCVLQSSSIFFAEIVDLPADHAANTFRRLKFNFGKRSLE